MLQDLLSKWKIRFKRAGLIFLRLDEPSSWAFYLFIYLFPSSFSSPISSLFISLRAAINLLGLTWQLKPSDGPVLNNGLGAGLPVNSDVATLPSGGRGMNCNTHAPLPHIFAWRSRHFTCLKKKEKRNLKVKAANVLHFFPLATDLVNITNSTINRS